MDITVKRNGYGSQLNSFSTNLLIPTIDKKYVYSFQYLFVLPTSLKQVKMYKILATLDNKIIAARQKNMLVTAFHPELTNDLRFHQYFLSMI